MPVVIYFKIPWVKNVYKSGTRLFWTLFVISNFVVATFIWYSRSHYYITSPAGGNGLIAVGRLLGLWGQLLILMELVLIGRIREIEQAFGFDRLNRYHRWIGYGILTFFIGHPLLLTLGYAQQESVGLAFTFSNFLANYEYVFLAFLGTVLFTFAVLLSLPIIRKKLRYEAWYFTHWLLYVAIGLVFTHEIKSGDVSRMPYLYYWCGLSFVIFGIMLAARFLRPLWYAIYYDFAVAKVVQETPDVCSVYITGNHLEQFSFKAGQYANLTFLSSGLWSPHPFSFSAEPNGQYVRFSIKGFGDYTKRIPQLTVGTRVIIDGPLGMFVDRTSLREKLLLIGGGIGITPLRALLGELAASNRSIVLLYSARTPADIAFKAELDQLQAAHPNIVIRYIVAAPTEGFESGFLDKEKIVRLVPDFFDRDVFLCGPPPMMAATVENLKGIGFDEAHIHHERFAF